MVELSPGDAEALGVGDGDRVAVTQNGSRVHGAVKLRAAVPAGSVFVAEGVPGEPANVLVEPFVRVSRAEGP